MKSVKINVEKIDLLDRKILYELDGNARATPTQIAARVHRSKQTVAYRVAQLEARGILLGRVAVANVASFGYRGRKVWLRLRKVGGNEENAVRKGLAAHKNVGWMVSCIGKWDLLLQAWFSSDAEFEAFISWLMGKHGESIGEWQTSIPLMNYYYRREYLAGKGMEKPAPWRLPSESSHEKCDAMDMKILQTWGVDVSRPVAEVAKKMGISPATAASRIARMEKNRMIIGYKPILSLQALGREYYKVLFEMEGFSPSVRKAAIARLASYPETVYVTETIGNENLEVEMEAESAYALNSRLRDFRERFGRHARRCDIILVDRELKHGHLPPAGEFVP